MVCENCSKELKFVPAGVSKSKKDKFGNPKAYNAFYSCDAKIGGCGLIKSADQPKPQSPAPTATGQNLGLKMIFEQGQEILESLTKLHEKMDNLESDEPASDEVKAPIATDPEPKLPWE